MPVKALVSAMDAGSLGPGEWAQIDNARIEKGLISCRGGVRLLGTVLASSTFRGSWSGFLWGSYTLLIGIEVSSAVRVYKTTDLSTYTEITTASTRFTAGNAIRFTVVPDPLVIGTSGYETGNTERVLMANGIDKVRCVGNSTACTIVQDVIPQSDMQTREVKVKIVDTYFNLQDTISYTNTASDLEGSDSGSAPNKQARITIFASVDLNDTCILDCAASGTTGATKQDRQFLIGLDTSYTSFWDKLKLEIGVSGGSFVTLWDPANPGTYARPQAVAIDSTQKSIWVFSVKKLPSGVAYDSIRLTWAVATNQAPSTNQTADIFLMGFTYGRDGRADYQIGNTNECEGSRTESPGNIFSTYSTQCIKDVGGPVLSDIRLPRSPILRAVFYAAYQNVTANEATAGVNRVNWYVKTTGSKKYRLWYSEQTYSGAYVYGASAGDVTYVYAGPDDTIPIDGDPVKVYPELYLPDGYQIAIPQASEVCWANNRLLVGKKKGTSQNLVISEFRNAFRCRNFQTFEGGIPSEQAATILSLEGETIQAIVPIAASTSGSSTIFIFTDRNIYAVSGQNTSQISQLGRVANIGTLSPGSIAADKGSVFFVDNEMQVRVLSNGGIQNITRSVVDDKLAAVPGSRRKWLWGTVSKEKYYIAYSESTTNNRVLVFDLDEGIWTTDTPPKSVDGIVSWFDGSSLTLRLISFGLDGTTLKAYEYDLASEAQDTGAANITVTLEPHELHTEDGGLFTVGRVKAMIDDLNSASATIVRTYLPSGVTQSTTMSLDTSEAHIYREDRVESATNSSTTVRPEGPRAKVTFSIPLQSGLKIRRLAVDITNLGVGSDRP